MIKAGIMEKKAFTDKIFEGAFEVAIISFPGLIPVERSAKDAYKQLAGGMLLKPVKSIKRVLPKRLRSLRAGSEAFGSWSEINRSAN